MYVKLDHKGLACATEMDMRSGIGSVCFLSKLMDEFLGESLTIVDHYGCVGIQGFGNFVFSAIKQWETPIRVP